MKEFYQLFPNYLKIKQNSQKLCENGTNFVKWCKNSSKLPILYKSIINFAKLRETEVKLPKLRKKEQMSDTIWRLNF